MEKYKKVLIGVGAATAAVAASAAVAYAVSKSLIKVALDREEPKIYKRAKKRLMGNEETAKLLEEMSLTAETFKAKQHETVEITANDGEKLVGHWFKNDNQKRVIIAMHGWRSSWAKDFCAIEDFWNETGCSVLYAEQRGQGTSGGEYMGFGMTERFDAASWVEYIASQVQEDTPIYLAGISMGASTVLMAAGLELKGNIRGIIADCGFTSADAIWKHVVNNNLKLSYTVFSAMANDLCKKRLNMSAKEYSTIKALEQTKIPVLFIHGTSDSFVPVEMTYENYLACASPKKLLVVPGAEHGMSYIVDTLAYKAAVNNFFDEFDKNEDK